MMPSPKTNTRHSNQEKAITVHRKVGSVRIISGMHRGRKLPVLLADGLRPTSDRVKETLFNWLMQDIVNASVLDMFAGAGSLGFEAISRQASKVTMIEINSKNAQQLRQNIALLKVQTQAKVVCADAFLALKSSPEKYDIVFIDPPFHKGLIVRAIDTLFEGNLLLETSLVYLESEASLAEFTHQHLVKIKENTTRDVHYRLYRVASLPLTL